METVSIVGERTTEPESVMINPETMDNISNAGEGTSDGPGKPVERVEKEDGE
jgi:hypothetical protein